MILDIFNRIKLDKETYNYFNKTVQKYLRKQYIDRYHFQLKIKNYKSTSELFSGVDNGSEKYLDNESQNIKRELLRYLNSEKAEKGRFQIFPSPKVSVFLEKKLDLHLIDKMDFAIQISAYCYEFFFITMPIYESFGKLPKDLDIGEIQNLNNISYIISKNKEDICDSFTNLKYNFSLLYAPISIGIHSNANKDKVSEIYRNHKNVSSFNELLTVTELEWFSIQFSEGFSNLVDYFYLEDQINSIKIEQNRKYINQVIDKHAIINHERDTYNKLKSLFVLFFADTALYLLKKKDYDFRNIRKNSRYIGNNKGVMRFLLSDFMPTVIKTIVSEVPKSDGYRIYNELTNLDSHRKRNNQDIEYDAEYFPTLNNFMNNCQKYLNNWYIAEKNNKMKSTTWKYFQKVSNNPSCYNWQDDVMNSEDLNKKFDYSDYLNE